MSTKKKAVVKKEDALPATGANVPSFMQKGIRGTETLGRDDFEIPSVAVLQALSPEVQQGHRVGFLYHNILEGLVHDEDGANTLLVVPVMNRVRYVLWNPRHAGGGMLAIAEDGVHWNKPGQEFKIKPKKDDPYEETWKIGATVHELTMCPGADGRPTKSVAEFGTSDLRREDAPPAATKSYNYVLRALNHMHIGPFITRLQKTSEKVGKKLNQKIRQAGVDSFGQVFKMGAEFVDNGPEDKFWRYTFANAGLLQDEHIYRECEAEYERFQALETWTIKGEEDDVPPVAPEEEGAPVSDDMT